ncbi:RIP metalloprotease RseP [Helicobacter kayseriensis]|uniref:RIP metalloprotease RseP n=1 Tax=Helicobacter kayseriensis TaxID=2905877 RepID=UPI001E2B658C|nr:RIP metalloprotease RseP [Helicobacter kayseriensis]MCE3047252.1 RIP metalloprotease RseP [Helicobacter kayseriensis]MCE3048623.1 RIP metalloprotease RseP [Helicobacter kayseriensis]
MNFVFALIALSFLIFFHELGHFLVARLFGVKVEVFSIGFGKKLFKKTYGDTEYALSLIPLGGYVKMKGQDDSDPLSKNADLDSYTSKTPFQRILILLAGPFFNIFLAFLIYVGFSYGNHQVLLPIVGGLQKDMPAEQSGILIGDRILEINGNVLKTWFDLAHIIQETKDKATFKIQRGEEVLEVGILPFEVERTNPFGEKVKIPAIGISPSGEMGNVYCGVFDALRLGIWQTIANGTLIIQGIEKLIVGVVPTSELGGVVGIVQVMNKAQENGIAQFLALVALISINLGVLNLFPIPALDGGHILFNLYELIMRRPLNEKAMYYLTLLGWGILLGLMCLGFYNDLNRIFKE